MGDTFQYSRQSFQNRARIATPDGVMWLTVPLVGGQHGTPIARMRVDERADWRRVHLKALRFNYGAAPFYIEYAPRIEALLAERHATLGSLTRATVELLARLLGVETRCTWASELPGNPATHAAVQDVLPTSEAHPLADSWEEAPRRQPFGGAFRADCSALDALMMYGPDARRFL